jgi:hypothetical protein
VADLTPQQARLRGRIERLIVVAAPALDLVLAVGDRIARVASRGDPEPYAVRRATEPALLEPPRPPASSPGDGGRR